MENKFRRDQFIANATLRQKTQNTESSDSEDDCVKALENSDIQTATSRVNQFDFCMREFARMRRER